MKNPFKKAAALSEAEQALKSWGIEYEKKPDGSISVSGDLNISRKNLTQLPDLSQVIVSGSFWCHNNQFTSLEGAPQTVGGDFYCYNNQLTSLEGAPQIVGGTFWCSNNQLTSLEGAPAAVGGHFGCSNNQLTSLKGAPQTAGFFSCSGNQLTSLEHAPQTVGGGFYCSDNRLTSLEHAPRTVGGDFFCNDNRLTSLEHAPPTVSTYFWCNNNQLTSLEGAPTSFKKLVSDLGEFSSWEAVPEKLRVSPETKARLEQERQTALDKAVRDTTVLQAPTKVRAPFKFRSRPPT